jgi:hypothetical protein
MKNVIKTKNLDFQYINEIENITTNPIFIMGMQRSGTSILYKLLSLTKSFNVVTAYHIIMYNELLHNHINNLEKKSQDDLNNFLKNKSQTDRAIDRLKINTDFPEEYGFILSKKDNQSKLTPKTLDTFSECCKKIQFISKNEKPILLKNPFDFANFRYIKTVFPKAKFIFIHRNPLKTLNSQIKAMRILLKNKSKYMALLSPQYNKVFENKILLNYYRFIYSPFTPIRAITAIRKLAKSTYHFLENIGSLHEADYINSRYEDICEEPDSEIEKILNFLDIKTKSNLQYSDLIKPRKTIILNEIRIFKPYILKKTKKYLSYCKYTSKDLQ